MNKHEDKTMRRYPGKRYRDGGPEVVPCPEFFPHVMADRRMPLVDRSPDISEPARPPPPSQELSDKVCFHLGNVEECITQQARLALHNWSRKVSRDEDALRLNSPGHRMRLTNYKES